MKKDSGKALTDRLSSRKEKENAELFLEHFPVSMHQDLKILCKHNGEVLLRENESAAFIFYLLSGKVKGISLQSVNSLYAFALFEAPAYLGEVEAFSGADHYRSTLICQGDCSFLEVPVESYLAWVKTDVKALYARTCAVTSMLVGQTRSERKSRFSTSRSRLVFYLVSLTAENGAPIDMKISCQDLADRIGCSTKTIQRSLQEMMQEGLITRQGRHLMISRDQARKLSTLVDSEE